MKETKLKTIVAQKAHEIKNAIEEAILDGAKVANYTGSVVIDDVIIVKGLFDFMVCLEFKSHILADNIKPSRAQIEEKLKSAEEEVIRIKNQLKQYDNETNND